MVSATRLVLSTPELLELILLHLPLPALLLNRRISSTFNTLINSSPALQHALFLRSSPSPKSQEWTLNPLLRKHFLPFFAAPENQFSTRDYSILTMLDWARDERARAAFLRKEASWRNMAVISHPPSRLRVRRYTEGDGGGAEDIAYIPFDDKSGVSMGVIYDIVHSFLVDNPVASFGVAFSKVQIRGSDNDEISNQGDEVGVTLHLELTVQCCVDESDDEEANRLRSEGEEATAHGLEWKTKVEWTDEDIFDDQFVPGLWEEWKSDLNTERGGLYEGEWEEWKSVRGQ